MTVPVTWSPRSLAPRSETVTLPYRPSSVSAPFSVTDPVSVMVQSGWFGAPSRMLTSDRRLRGPDQSVT